MTSGTNWVIVYDERVISRDIPALDHAMRKRIREVIEQKLTADPIHFGKPLRYSLSGQRSLRVGDWRVVYALNPPEHTVQITAIRHRRDVYEV
jgi:mRNA interferase RelE/StbE